MWTKLLLVGKTKEKELNPRIVGTRSRLSSDISGLPYPYSLDASLGGFIIIIVLKIFDERLKNSLGPSIVSRAS